MKANSNSNNQNDLRILIIDDFEMGRQILKTALVELGHMKIFEAEDGQVAVDLLNSADNRQTPFDFIFCDWNMPNLNGMQVLKIVRGDRVYGQVPFVMVTAEGDQENVLAALTAGASDYIVKPISKELLEQKMSRVFSKLQRSTKRSA